MFDWNVYVCHIFGGGGTKKSLLVVIKWDMPCMKIDEINTWNSLFIFAQIPWKQRKKIQNESWAAKKKQLRKTWKKICIDDGGVTAEWRVHTEKKKPKLKMEPPKKRISCVKTVWLAQWMAYEMEEWMKWHGSNRWMDGWLVGWKYGWMEMPADCEPVWLASDSHGMVREYGRI